MKKADLSEDPIIGRLKYAQGDFGILAKQTPPTGLAAHQRRNIELIIYEHCVRTAAPLLSTLSVSMSANKAVLPPLPHA